MPKGSKNKDTILKEERLAIFEAEMSKMYLDKIHEAKPEYLLDRFLGKITDKLEVTGEVKTIPLDQKKLEEINKIALDESSE